MSRRYESQETAKPRPTNAWPGGRKKVWCLQCEEPFTSTSKMNRMCKRCRTADQVSYADGADLRGRARTPAQIEADKARGVALSRRHATGSIPMTIRRFRAPGTEIVVVPKEIRPWMRQPGD
jgi:hypothetical protein